MPCYKAVNIGSIRAEMYAGGIIGNCDGSNISATLNAGKVTADLNVGASLAKVQVQNQGMRQCGRDKPYRLQPLQSTLSQRHLWQRFLFGHQ